MKKFIFIVALLICIINKLQGQPLSLSQLKGYGGWFLAKSYDGGWYVTMEKHVEYKTMIVKLDSRGQILNIIQLIGIVSPSRIYATSDSGLAVAVSVKTHPEIPINYDDLDTTDKAAFLKFDKCLNLEWAYYTSSSGNIASGTITETANGDLIFVSSGINGHNMYLDKVVTLIRFDKHGKLLNTVSMECSNAFLTNNYDKKHIYATGFQNLSLNNSDSLYYFFGVIYKYDAGLNLKARVAVGFKDTSFGVFGGVLARNNIVRSMNAVYKNGKNMTMYRVYDENLRDIAPPVFDEDSACDMIIQCRSAFTNDSIITLNSLLSYNPDNKYISLRIYDTTFKLLDEVRVSQGIYSYSVEFLSYDDKIILALLDERVNGYTYFYLFDHKLNQLKWEDQPAGRYNFACNDVDSIQYIDILHTAKPLFIPKDTTPADFSWVYDTSSTSIKPEFLVKGRLSNNFFIWPQPAKIGEMVYFSKKEQDKVSRNGNLEVNVYDLMGRRVSRLTAAPLAQNLWTLSTIGIKNPGYYILELKESGSEKVLGKIKILLQ